MKDYYNVNDYIKYSSKPNEHVKTTVSTYIKKNFYI